MDENFPAVRKSLNILSVLILILAFSNAHVNEINFLGIDLELEGEKLYVGLYVIYIYFIWRYVTKLPYRSKGGFIDKYHKFLFSSKKGLIKHYPYEKIRKRLVEDNDSLKENHQRKLIRPIDQQITRFPDKPFNSIRIIQKYYLNIPSEDLVYEEDRNNKSAYIDVKVSWLLIVRKFIWFSLKHDKFGDFLFPFIPIIVNLLFFLFKDQWQGSFRQLILN